MPKIMMNSIENFEQHVNAAFVAKAEALKPELIRKTIRPLRTVRLAEDRGLYQAEVQEDIRQEADGTLSLKPRLRKGNSVIYDFGDHCVGYVTLKLSSAGSPPDAPAYFRLKFGEMPYEIGLDSESYDGSISSSWIQEEVLHVDVLPAEVHLPRRYAFRYMEVLVKDTSPKYDLVIEDVSCETVTSADRDRLLPLPEGTDPALVLLDKVGVKTLEDCMQDVFEDGPKRDRRLWIGDLRLQAQVNYLTFRNYDLVKRCLYLFAGLLQNEDHVGACLFTEPKLQIDDTSMYDYGLFFTSILLDYYEASKDLGTLKELAPVAYHQEELGLEQTDEDGVYLNDGRNWCFIDWNHELDKQASGQGVLIYTLKQAKKIAEILGDREKAEELAGSIEKCTEGAIRKLWDPEKRFFVSGPTKQISYASQIWMILAGAVEQETAKDILLRLLRDGNEYTMITPYIHHHFVAALIQSGLKAEALSYMKAYWGQMIADGADTYFEAYDPKNRSVSPYGSLIINSFCHAWSCGPAYFIRKYYI